MAAGGHAPSPGLFSQTWQHTPRCLAAGAPWPPPHRVSHATPLSADLGKAKELFEMAQKRNPNLKPPNLDAMVAAEAQRSTGATPGTPAAALPQVPRAAPPPGTCRKHPLPYLSWSW